MTSPRRPLALPVDRSGDGLTSTNGRSVCPFVGARSRAAEDSPGGQNRWHSAQPRRLAGTFAPNLAHTDLLVLDPLVEVGAHVAAIATEPDVRQLALAGRLAHPRHR